MSEREVHVITGDEAGVRIDRVLSGAFPDLSRTFIRELIDGLERQVSLAAQT